MAEPGEVRQGRHGQVWHGPERPGRHGKARLGCVGLGQFNIAKVLSNHEIIYRLRCEVGGLLGITF